MAARDLPIRQDFTLPSWMMTEAFVLAGGPGGQNVNKVSTAVQLRFNARAAKELFTERQFQRLMKIAGRKATKDGEILIESSTFRSQDRNREEARERLRALILEALKPPPPPRKKTRPSKGAIERRLKSKAERSQIKSKRGRVQSGDE